MIRFEEHIKIGKVLKELDKLLSTEIISKKTQKAAKFELKAEKFLGELRSIMDVIVYRDYPEEDFRKSVSCYFGKGKK